MYPTIVIDASVVLKWYLQEEYSQEADSLSKAYLKKEIEIITPVILKLEVINSLLSAATSKRLSFEHARQLISSFVKLGLREIDIKDETHYSRMFDIAQKYKLSVYDGSYVALAEYKQCGFYTADRKLYFKLHKDIKFVKMIEEFK